MGNIGVYLTDRKQIFVVSCASKLPSLLGENEVVTESWFYNRPPELQRFFKKHPEEEDLFDQAFAYWVICKVFRKEQSETAYGMLKRELSEFCSGLLTKIRNLVKAAVSDIRSFWSRKEKKVEKFFKRNHLDPPSKRFYLRNLYY